MPPEISAESLRGVLEVVRLTNAETDLGSLVTLIAQQACALLSADRETLYLLEKESGELRSSMALGLQGKTIRLKLEHGVVGLVATTGQPIVVDQAFADARFNRAVHKVAESFHAKANEPKLQLAVEVAEALPQVLADPQELQMALTHLVENAAKFTPAGGRVTVAAKPTVEPEGRLAVEIAVRDTGIGIPPHLHAKVLDRFSQVDGSLTRKVGGVGIGLAVVKQIIEAHGSHVVLESEPGEGWTFRFMLPAAG